MIRLKPEGAGRWRCPSTGEGYAETDGELSLDSDGVA